MQWSRVKKIAFSLPIAALAALMLIAINEAGFRSSAYALEQMEQKQALRYSVSQLLQSMLDAETGNRGYLLTGEERYLEPYEQAISTVNANLDAVRTLVVASNADLSEFAQLSRQVSRKLSEMDLSIRLRRQGNEDAWKFVLSTDVGLENMQGVRQHAKALIKSATSALKETQIQIQKSLMLARVGIAAACVIGLMAVYLYLRQTNALQHATEREQVLLEAERARLESLVRTRTEALSELANHLQRVREEERERLARELHDELGALLTSAKLDVARLKSKMGATNPDAAERLQHLSEALNSVIALKRRIVEDLRPSSLSNLGLTAAIEILTREFAARAGLDVQVSLEPVNLQETTQLTIYRMVQESLTNIAKYASAKQVLVTIHNYPTYVSVEIRDDGQGFDMANISRSSHGLLGMRQRVESEGGRLTITSTKGAGTLVAAVIPLPAEASLLDASGASA